MKPTQVLLSPTAMKMLWKSKPLLAAGGLLATLTACESTSFSDLESATGTTTTITAEPPCDITSTTPSTTTVRMPATGTKASTFSAGTTSTACVATYKLNGTALTANKDKPTIDLLPTELTQGSNTLELTVTDGKVTKTTSWTIKRNTPPACSGRNPTLDTQSVGVSSTINLTAYGNDSDQDPITFKWLDNGTELQAPVLTTFGAAGLSLATFVPTALYVGSNRVSAQISDGYDTASCDWTVTVINNCSLANFSPASALPRVSSVPSTSTPFTVIPNDGTCTVSWELNGASLSSSALSINMLSSDLDPGNNTLKATLSNGTSTVVKTWNVRKNTPPTCGGQSPSAGGNTVNVGSPITLVATGTDVNSDSLSFAWKANGNTANPTQFTISSPSATQNQAIFTPTSAYAGSNAISADISDGLDSASCTWAVQVINNCAFVSSSPSAASVRVSNVGTTSTNFVATANDAACNITWALNGSSLAQTGSLVSVASSNLIPGSNTLIATASNGLSTVQKVWTVVKNTPPTCDSQTPAASGNSVGVGAPLTLRANGLDGNSDTMSFAWKSNGTAVNPAHYAITTPATGASQAVFTSTSAYLGANNVTAEINDGYDTTSCAWTVTVVNNCTVSSSLPSGATSRVAAAPTASNNFVIVPNDSGCSVTWKLNGVDLSGASTFRSIQSSDLTTGSNTLLATASNGVGTPATRTWTITKNAVPTCQLQTATPAPAASMLYTDTKTLSATVNDTDGDAMVSFTWTYNGGTSTSLYPPGQVTSGSASSQAVFRPTLGEVGPSRTLAADFFDGYDTGRCTWSMQIDDPNAALVINNCSPTPYTTTHNAPPADASAVVIPSTTANTLFNTSATGTLLTYQWKLNGNSVSGATSSSYSLPYADLPSASQGYSTLEAEITDAYGAKGYCVYKVKKNFAPVISMISPSNASVIKMNSSTTQAMSVTATDDNGDTLNYTWTLDSLSQPGYLPTGNSTSTFSPLQQSSLLGDRTLRVTITDTAGESATRAWSVNVNEFSTTCNNLSAGQMCTVIGMPGMGDGVNPADDQTKLRFQPSNIVDDGSGNWFVADAHNHTVGFLNRSGASVTRLGKTITSGQYVVLTGNGAPGRNEENLGYTYKENKLNTPMGLAYDATGDRLWIADSGNHRVVQLSSSGAFTTVFGNLTATQNTAGNTDNTAGTSHVCGAPHGLWYYPGPGPGNTANLYIACYSTHAIKRYDPSTGKGYIVVGALSGVSPNQTTAPAAPATIASGTAGAAGVAQVYFPRALTGDPSTGSLYFTESSWSWSVDSTLRVYNQSGSTVAYLADATAAASLTVADATASGTLTTSSALSLGRIVSTSYAPNRLDVIGPTSLLNNGCYPMSVVTKALNGDVINISGGPLAFNLTTSGTGAFYSNAACSAAITTGSIATGASNFVFYYRPTAVTASKIVTATRTSGPAAFTGNLTHNVVTGSTATKLEIVGPATLPAGSCQIYAIDSVDASGVASVTAAARNILLDDGGVPGTFYADAACVTPASQVVVSGTAYSYVTLAASTATTSVYYRKPLGNSDGAGISVSSGTVGRLLGTVNPNTGASGAWAISTVTGDYDRANPGYPTGISLWMSGSTLKGVFLYNNYASYYVTLFNTQASGDLVVGGKRVGPGESMVVMGTATAGYNGEDLGTLTRLNGIQNASGMTGLMTRSNQLVIADVANNRLRTLDLSTAMGQTATAMGAGRIRSGFLTDSSMSAPRVMLNTPSFLSINSSTHTLYYSDSGNFRIRATNLKTGMASTVVGTASGGDGSIDNQDPLAVLMRSPQGVLSYGSAILYMDQSSSNCLMRAYNPTASPLSMFGGMMTIQANSVSTVAGNLSQGCVAWNAGTPANTDGMSANTAHLTTSDGIATDGSSIYIASSGDHCILKMDSTGKLYQFAGLCGTNGFADGLANTAIRFTTPLGIAMDPDPANPNNFFVVDATTSGVVSRIRYVNQKLSSVTLSGITVAAATSGTWAGGNVIPQIKTLYSGTAAGIQRWNAIAATGNWICYSGGVTGDTGSHNLQCRDRTQTLPDKRFGLDETSNAVTTRAGASLGVEQEGTTALNAARFYTPYGMVFDSDGNLYIAERSSHVIRMIKKWW